MMTIVTHVHLKEGAGRDWDAAMRTRLLASKKRPGWVGGQLLRPADKPDRRVIVGTWKTRADWEAWHHDPQFTETRQRLDGLESAPAEHWWHRSVLHIPFACPHAAPGQREFLTQVRGIAQPREQLLSIIRVGGRRTPPSTMQSSTPALE